MLECKRMLLDLIAAALRRRCRPSTGHRPIHPEPTGPIAPGANPEDLG